MYHSSAAADRPPVDAVDAVAAGNWAVTGPRLRKLLEIQSNASAKLQKILYNHKSANRKSPPQPTPLIVPLRYDAAFSMTPISERRLRRLGNQLSGHRPEIGAVLTMHSSLPNSEFLMYLEPLFCKLNMNFNKLSEPNALNCCYEIRQRLRFYKRITVACRNFVSFQPGNP